MTPTEIDVIADQIKKASGAAHVEIRLTYAQGHTLTHEAGQHPQDSEDWAGIVERIKADRAKLITEPSDG